jgi:predicted DNA-binding mobile mystery protein A
MKNQKNYLLLQQTDRKLEFFKVVKTINVPQNGWLQTFRKSINMSLRQFGDRLSISPQGVKEIEARESNGTITLNSLRDAANALDMQLVYGFISKHESLELMIENRAKDLAIEIVTRTNNSMILEDQQNSIDRISQAINQKIAEIKYEMPKYLWD